MQENKKISESLIFKKNLDCYLLSLFSSLSKVRTPVFTRKELIVCRRFEPSLLQTTPYVTIPLLIYVFFETSHLQQHFISSCFEDLLCKSMDWFPYDNGLRHERVITFSFYGVLVSTLSTLQWTPDRGLKSDFTSFRKVFYLCQ